jgi:hypothetical protein
MTGSLSTNLGVNVPESTGNARASLKSRSAAADSDDDLELVSIGDGMRRELAARNDLAVALYRDALAREAEMFYQLCDGKGDIELLGLPIDSHSDHFRKRWGVNRLSMALRTHRTVKYIWFDGLPLPACAGQNVTRAETPSSQFRPGAGS